MIQIQYVFASSRSDVNEISQFLEEEIAERIQNDENNSGEKEFDYKKLVHII